MAEKLKIIPLGGLNEIGKNMTVYEYGGEIIVVDCGMAFPGDDLYGIDSIIDIEDILPIFLLIFFKRKGPAQKAALKKRALRLP